LIVFERDKAIAVPETIISLFQGVNYVGVVGEPALRGSSVTRENYREGRAVLVAYSLPLVENSGIRTIAIVL
jgi:hypothetical protein